MHAAWFCVVAALVPRSTDTVQSINVNISVFGRHFARIQKIGGLGSIEIGNH